MQTLTVRNSKKGPVLGRHPWVFSKAIVNIPDGLQSGTPVRLMDEDGRFLALGYFNAYSQISVRIWGFDQSEAIGSDFFMSRISRAYNLRTKYIDQSKTDSYRIINGESDLLPGLIVDKYSDCLCLQFHTAGMASHKDLIVEALCKLLNPRGIYERSDVLVRKSEGTGSLKGLLYGTVPDLITIRENGLKFLVDIKEGQKTGFFLDQRDKRLAIMRYAGDTSVLNCFSYTGAFSVYALYGGARNIVSVEVSKTANELAKENIKINGLDISRCEFVCADVKDYLKAGARGRFDTIVLDPPAFVKDRRRKAEGIAGYKSINQNALSMLADGGILFTCSCSAHLSAEEFRYILSEAGGRSGKSLQIIESFGHGIDHPVLAPYTEGEYLKCLALRVL